MSSTNTAGFSSSLFLRVVEELEMKFPDLATEEGAPVITSEHAISSKATPIYLLVLRAQEVGNEPFWNKKKVEKCDFFFFFLKSDD